MTNPRPTSESSTPAPHGGWRAKLRLAGLRSWLGQNRRLVLIGVCGLTFIVLTFATLDYFIAPNETVELPPPKLETALALLDGGQVVAAREAAEKIQVGRKLHAHEYGAPAYIIGAT